jgi:hypothetical protein
MNNMPRKLTEKIANRIVEEIKAYGMQRNWTATEFVKPYARKGRFGIKIDEVPWLYFQNYGTKPHIPWALEGKIVPMSFGFRKANGVGQPGYVDIDGIEVWREEKWLNPGINETNFVEAAAAKACTLYRKDIAKYSNVKRIVRK